MYPAREHVLSCLLDVSTESRKPADHQHRLDPLQKAALKFNRMQDREEPAKSFLFGLAKSGHFHPAVRATFYVQMTIRTISNSRCSLVRSARGSVRVAKAVASGPRDISFNATPVVVCEMLHLA